MKQNSDSNTQNPKMYRQLAEWWPLLSAPADYADEAAFFSRILLEATDRPPKTLLELGSGGGNNASHMKAHFQMTLVELSPDMLAVSQQLNPECEHIQGDMRTVRLGRQFEAVFIHDAIEYMTAEADLRQALETAYLHCQPGGVALFVPDHVKETFAPATGQGGHNGPTRAMRYLEWSHDPDPNDSAYIVDYAFMLKDGADTVQVVHDRHTLGLFPRATWLRLLAEVGFKARIVEDDYKRELFVAVRE